MDKGLRCLQPCSNLCNWLQGGIKAKVRQNIPHIEPHVLDRILSHICQPNKCHILAVTRGIQALPDMYVLGPEALGQSGIHAH